MPFFVGLLEIEGVVHRPRRVALGDVEGGEVVPVVLDLRTGGDRKAQIGEDLGQLVHHLADRMDAALRGRFGRKRHVEGLGSQPALQLGFLEGGLSRSDRLRHFLAQRVDSGALVLTLLWRHAAKGLQQLGHGTLLAERGDTFGLQRRQVRRRVDPRNQVLLHLVEVRGHGALKQEAAQKAKVASGPYSFRRLRLARAV